MRTKVFNDFDEFALTIRDVDAVMTLQNPARHLWSVNQIDLGGIEIQHGRLGSGNIVEGKSWKNGFVLYFPHSKTCEYRINGSAFTNEEFMVLKPGEEFSLTTNSSHEWSTLFFPIDECGIGSDFILPTSGPRIAQFPHEDVNSEFHQTLTNLRSIVTGILGCSANSDQFEHSFGAELAREALLNVFKSADGSKRASKNNRIGRPMRSRGHIIRQCKDFEKTHAEQNYSVADLASAANISERTLRLVFNEYFGIPPTKYFQLRRLHLVRTALKKADPTVTKTSDVLVKFGEWEFGRFAMRYKHIFGELPSDTLLKRYK